MKIKVSSPLHVILPRKTKADKKFYLNLNTYRNTHFVMLNQVKKNYSALFADNDKLKEIESAPSIRISYEFYAPDKRRRDLMNVVAILDKFFLDALVENGYIKDDDVHTVSYGSIKYAGIDRKRPRVDIFIETID